MNGAGIIGRRIVDETGRRHGRLTVMAFAGLDHQRRALWRASCDCGGETVTTGQLMRGGTTRSCGCIRREQSRANYVAANARRYGHSEASA
jgi:hypothetical protein